MDPYGGVEFLDKADGYEFTEDDQQMIATGDGQLVGEFLLDRDGVVRWCLHRSRGGRPPYVRRSGASGSDVGSVEYRCLAFGGDDRLLQRSFEGRGVHCLQRRLDETVARRGDLYAARLVDMAMQEEAGEPEGSDKAFAISRLDGTGGKEGRQRQHLVGPWQACRTADGTSCLR